MYVQVKILNATETRYVQQKWQYEWWELSPRQYYNIIITHPDRWLWWDIFAELLFERGGMKMWGAARSTSNSSHFTNRRKSAKTKSWLQVCASIFALGCLFGMQVVKFQESQAISYLPNIMLAEAQPNNDNIEGIIQNCQPITNLEKEKIAREIRGYEASSKFQSKIVRRPVSLRWCRTKKKSLFLTPTDWLIHITMPRMNWRVTNRSTDPPWIT